ncbi:MAG: tetratricopeptide repeat protein [Candidatus Latescibacteria bacterium]|nr:tetratricopeptide repeat protein [Candidatus Latescibacterota bacterium]
MSFWLAIYLGCLWFFAAGTPIQAQSAEVAEKYRKEARELYREGQYLQAAQGYVQAAAAEKASPQPRLDKLGGQLGWAGLSFISAGQYEKALPHCREALAVFRDLGNERESANHLNNMATAYYYLSRYQEALAHYQEALTLNRKLDRKSQIASQLNSIGLIHMDQDRYEEALVSLLEAQEINRQRGREAAAALQLNNIGRIYKLQGRYEEAVAHFREALEINGKNAKQDLMASNLANLGSVYAAWGRYEDALYRYGEALRLNRELGSDSGIATQLNNLGTVYVKQGRYQEALVHYEEALEINRTLGRKGSIIAQLNNIGRVYADWGSYKKALEHYREALDLCRQLDRQGDVATLLNNTGSVYEKWGRYEEALVHYREALAIDRQLGRKGNTATRLNNIGLVYDRLGQHEDALVHLREGLAISRQLGQEASIATLTNNIGLAYNNLERYTEALAHFEEALALNRKMGREAEITDQLHNIGSLHLYAERYPEALAHFEEGVAIKEELRQTASGAVRRDYLASQIQTYEYLTATQLRRGDAAAALQAIELSRAKLLAEQLAGADQAVSVPLVEDVQASLAEGTAILVYANVDRSDKVLLALTREGLFSREEADSNLVAAALAQYRAPVRQLAENQRGLKKKPDLSAMGAAPEEDEFAEIVQYYRSQLAHAATPDSNRIAATSLHRLLYDFLIAPLEDQLDGKTQLLIVPDGILGFVPFETLVDPQGRYLVERFDIRYIQSLGVLDLIGQRQYPADRKPLLALGGAVYDETAYTADMIDNEVQMASLEKDVYSSLDQSRSFGNAYAALGQAQWDNLPGTLDEVQALARSVPGTELITGDQVTENRLKELSATGALAGYRVLHFATHGLVVPELPDLSALVLSQLAEERDGEDGYVRMGEIAALDLQADFVNLSACETGLGKIYGGEGVVGLTQAFLLAGANGLSVSLWPVADRSTAQLMAGLYELVQEQGVDYAAGLAQMKRAFIRGDFGDAYRAPFYWAPFVYYGQ